MQSTEFMFNGKSSLEMGITNVRVEKSEATIELFGGQDILFNTFGFNDTRFSYGKKTRPITFEMVLTMGEKKWNDNIITKIMDWLITDDYKPFISGDNPEKVYYAMVTNQIDLTSICNYGYFTVRFETNSSTGFTHPQEDIIEVKGSKNYTIYNPSNVTEFYYPTLEIQFKDSNTISIVNTSDENREFKLVGSGKEKVIVSNEFALFESSLPYNYYEHFNKNWFRLKKGANNLQILGNCSLNILSQYPII